MLQYFYIIHIQVKFSNDSSKLCLSSICSPSSPHEGTRLSHHLFPAKPVRYKFIMTFRIFFFLSIYYCLYFNCIDRNVSPCCHNKFLMPLFFSVIIMTTITFTLVNLQQSTFIKSSGLPAQSCPVPPSPHPKFPQTACKTHTVCV